MSRCARHADHSSDLRPRIVTISHGPTKRTVGSTPQNTKAKTLSIDERSTKGSTCKSQTKQKAASEKNLQTHFAQRCHMMQMLEVQRRRVLGRILSHPSSSTARDEPWKFVLGTLQATWPNLPKHVSFLFVLLLQWSDLINVSKTGM